MMRVPKPRKHWTPQYVRDRIALYRWQRAHPGAPWLAPGAISFLDQALAPSDVMVEFGSGRSTLWFARRAGAVISVEHHPQWYESVRRQLDEAGASNVTYLQAPNEPEVYAAAPDAALADLGRRPTVVLVDGRQRDECALWALDHLDPAGLLIVDNAERYLPGPSRAPTSIGPDAAPASPKWAEFARRTAGVRQVWFASGVTDTLIFLLGSPVPPPLESARSSIQPASAEAR